MNGLHSFKDGSTPKVKDIYVESRETIKIFLNRITVIYICKFIMFQVYNIPTPISSQVSKFLSQCHQCPFCPPPCLYGRHLSLHYCPSVPLPNLSPHPKPYLRDKVPTKDLCCLLPLLPLGIWYFHTNFLYILHKKDPFMSAFFPLTNLT